MIRINELSFGYGKKPFIEDMSFSVEKGEIFGFLGPSGAGKSTLQKLLIGLLPGYSGNIRVFGGEVKNHGRDFYERIGIDFEFPTLYDKLSARQNLRFFASLYKNPVRDMDALFKRVDLLNDADKKVFEFSKGMKSRLCFIRSLINNPDILFLDEPTGGLDPTNARLDKETILEERAKGKTIILTTHRMEDAQEMCDRVAFIVSGRIVALDSPRSLILKRGASSLRYSFLEEGLEQAKECSLHETGTDERLSQLIRDGKLLTIHSAEPNLGDIFMEVTGRSLV